MKTQLPILLNLGFNNYIMTNQIVGIIDYSSGVAKTLVRTARADKGNRSVIDLTRGKKIYSLVILLGDRYVLSTIPRKQLARRLGAFDEEDVPQTKANRQPQKASPPPSSN